MTARSFQLLYGNMKPIEDVTLPTLGAATHEAARRTLGVPGVALTLLVTDPKGVVRAQAWEGKAYRVKDCPKCKGLGTAAPIGRRCSLCEGLKWRVDERDVICEVRSRDARYDT